MNVPVFASIVALGRVVLIDFEARIAIAGFMTIAIARTHSRTTMTLAT